jgi:hypothetical protein
LTQLNLPDGSRAWQLFKHLEETFANFLLKLSPAIKELAQQQGAYHGDFDRTPFGGLGTLNPVLVGTPWLFWDCFEELDDEMLLRIAEAGGFYVLASVVLDHLVDKQVFEPGMLTIYHQILYSQGVREFHLIFPAASPFWSDFQRLEARHLNGLATEVYLQSHPAGFTSQTLATIAHGKVSPIITTLVALSFAIERLQNIPALEASLDHIAVASQLLDDIGDWQVDLKNQHMTYFLAELAKTQISTHPDWPSQEALELKLQSEWVDIIHLKQVMQGLDLAIESVRGLDCPDWLRYVEGYRTLTDGHLDRTITLHLGQVFHRMHRPRGS